MSLISECLRQMRMREKSAFMPGLMTGIALGGQSTGGNPIQGAYNANPAIISMKGWDLPRTGPGLGGTLGNPRSMPYATNPAHITIRGNQDGTLFRGLGEQGTGNPGFKPSYPSNAPQINSSNPLYTDNQKLSRLGGTGLWPVPMGPKNPVNQGTGNNGFNPSGSNAPQINGGFFYRQPGSLMNSARNMSNLIENMSAGRPAWDRNVYAKRQHNI